MQEKLRNFAQLPAHCVTDSCIVALLSHGVEGGVYGVDGTLLQVRAVPWPQLCKLGRFTSRLPLSPGMAAVVCRTQEVPLTTNRPSPFFVSGSYKRFFGSLTMPTARAYRTNRKCSSSRRAVEVSALADQRLGVAPGQPPTSSHFPVCSSQVLLDPLGTSFCSLLPPPLLLCKCLPMHGVCWDLGSPWLSGWSALCALPRPVLQTLFTSVFAFLPEDASFSLCLLTLMSFFGYSFQLRIFWLSLLPSPLTLSSSSFFSPPLLPLSTFSFYFSSHLHSILVSSPLCVTHGSCRQAAQKPRVGLWLVLFCELLPSLFFLARRLFYPLQSQDSPTRLRRHGGLLLILEENSNHSKL